MGKKATKKERIRYTLNVAALAINAKKTSGAFSVVPPHSGHDWEGRGREFKNVVGEGSASRKEGSLISR